MQGIEPDVSAVYEDVEAWVKSVYTGGKTPESEPEPIDHRADENKSLNSSHPSTCIPKRKSQTQKKIKESENYASWESQEQQAAEDQAFLDAILLATE